MRGSVSSSIRGKMVRAWSKSSCSLKHYWRTLETTWFSSETGRRRLRPGALNQTESVLVQAGRGDSSQPTTRYPAPASTCALSWESSPLLPTSRQEHIGIDDETHKRPAMTATEAQLARSIRVACRLPHWNESATDNALHISRLPPRARWPPRREAAHRAPRPGC